MPQLPIKKLRLQTKAALNQLSDDVRILVYGCDHSIDVEELKNSGVAALSLTCIGMLPPSFIDYVLQEGTADGVFITGCASGDCYYRHGNTWTEQRILGQREPYLRARVAREKIEVFWTGPLQKKELSQKIQDFRNRLKGFDHD
jgi:coenzyme F420-reducing hydrogenase delta subunit